MTELESPTLKRASASQLEIALAHAALGRRVFPFRLSEADASGHRDKKPLVKWSADATTDPETIRRWAKRFPTAHYGWNLEPGLVVVDIDDAAAFLGTGLELPSAPSQTTPSGGSHHLYQGDGVKQTVKAVPGLDTRVGGKGFVGLYAVDAFTGPPASPPAWLVDVGTNETAPLVSEDEPINSRHEITQVMGKWRREGKTAAEVRTLLYGMYAEGMLTESDQGRPWTKKDLDDLAAEAGKWEAGEIITDELRRKFKVRAVKREEPEESIWTPLSAVPRGDAEPLLLGRLHPADHTVLFGTGGTGKGVVAAWWAARLSVGGDARHVLIVDYEQKAQYEWAPRVEAFGGDMDLVQIYQPIGAIWDEAEAIARELTGFTRPYLIIDSITPALGNQEVEKSKAATMYKRALDDIWRRSGLGKLGMLSLAHTTKDNENPKYPFGSVFWHNNARVTISLVGDEYRPRVLTQRKTNQKALFQTVDIDWSWSEFEELPRTLIETPHIPAVIWRAIDLFNHVPAMADAWLSPAEITKQVNEDGGSKVTKRTVERALAKSDWRSRRTGGRGGAQEWRPDRFEVMPSVAKEQDA
jgi:hypothetical protein